MTAWVLAVGRMLGLGSLAGIRPSLTLAVIGVVSYFDWGMEINSSFSWLSHWLAIGIFVVLAILESAFDKISKLDRLQDRLIMPYRLFGGAVAGAATVPFGWRGIVVGAAVGAGAAWFAQYTKHLSRPKSVPSEALRTLISTGEDLGAFLGNALILAVPYVGYAAVGVTGFVYWRVRGRRSAKYRQMRRAAVAPPPARPQGGPGPSAAAPSPDGPGPPAAAGAGRRGYPGDGASAPLGGLTPAAGGPVGSPGTTALEAGVKSAEPDRGDDER